MNGMGVRGEEGGGDGFETALVAINRLLNNGGSVPVIPGHPVNAQSESRATRGQGGEWSWQVLGKLPLSTLPTMGWKWVG